MAPVGHFVLHRPSPLQRTGLTTTFLPCFVSLDFEGAVGADLGAGAAAHALLLVDRADGARGDDDVVGEKGQGPARRTVGLVDRLLDELRVVGKAAQVDAVGRKLDGAQFHVGLFEEAVGGERHLELARDFFRRRGGDDGGGKRYDVGIELELLAEDVVGDRDLQDIALVFGLAGFDLGLRLPVRSG